MSDIVDIMLVSYSITLGLCPMLSALFEILKLLLITEKKYHDINCWYACSSTKCMSNNNGPIVNTSKFGGEGALVSSSGCDEFPFKEPDKMSQIEIKYGDTTKVDPCPCLCSLLSLAYPAKHT